MGRRNWFINKIYADAYMYYIISGLKPKYFNTCKENINSCIV